MSQLKEILEIDKPTLISLFSGAGGLDLGMESAGFSTVVAMELEETYCQTLRENKFLGSSAPKKEFEIWLKKQLAQRCYKNIPSFQFEELRTRLLKGAGKHEHFKDAEVICGDIRKISSDTLMNRAQVKRGQIDLIIGGPPCQPFSRAGKRETVETSDGRLFLEFVRIVNGLKPRWFVFENVKGLAQSKTEVVYLRCYHCNFEQPVTLDDRDRFLSGRQITTKTNCIKCGRNTKACSNRISGGTLDIILEEFRKIGYLCYSEILIGTDFGVPQTRERLFIVGSRDHESFEWPEPTNMKLMEDSNLTLFPNNKNKDPWIGMYDAIWQQGHAKYGKINKEKAVLWVKNVVRPHDEPVTWHLDRPSPTIGAHQSAKLALAPFGVPEEQLYRQQWHTKGRRQGDTPPVFVEHEYLSDRELLLLQSFPEYWYLSGTRMERAFQIGNAVPPKLAKAIGVAIMNKITAKAKMSKSDFVMTLRSC